MPGVTPLTTVRRMDLPPLRGVPDDDVLLSIAAELERRGNHVRSCAGHTVEFDSPSPSGGKTPHRAQAAVRGGTVTLEAAGMAPRVRVELRYSVDVTYFVPALLTLVAALADISTPARVLMVATVAALTWLRCHNARSTYESWVAEGARHAPRYAGTARLNAGAGAQGGEPPPSV
jgi:hypothetical protein